MKIKQQSNESAQYQADAAVHTPYPSARVLYSPRKFPARESPTQRERARIIYARAKINSASRVALRRQLPEQQQRRGASHTIIHYSSYTLRANTIQSRPGRNDADINDDCTINDGNECHELRALLLTREGERPKAASRVRDDSRRRVCR